MKIRIDKKSNLATIRKYWIEHFNRHGRAPSQFELSKYTGLSELTVWKHLKDFKIDLNTSDYRIAVDSVVEKILRVVHSEESKTSDSLRACEVFLKYFTGIDIEDHHTSNFQINIKTTPSEPKGLLNGKEVKD